MQASLEDLAIPVSGPVALGLDSGWPTLYRPVVSYTFLRDSGQGKQVLIGVRDPATNRFHPDVVSVPTRRIPIDVAELLLRNASADPPHSDAEPLPLELFLAREVLQAKLGFGDAIDLPAHLNARLNRLDFGESLIGHVGGEDVTEHLGMFGMVVDVSDEVLVSSTTDSYSHLMWLDLDRFLLLAVTRDTSLLPIGLKAAEVCVHGLCMRSAAEIVRTIVAC